MADAVTSNVIFASRNKRVVHFTNISDGTGESDVVKVDISGLFGPDGTVPTSLTIEKVEYVVDGMQLRIEWDATADDVALVLTGSGFFDFTEAGGLRDPKSTGSTGDILFTTNGHNAGDAYTVTLWLRLED